MSNAAVSDHMSGPIWSKGGSSANQTSRRKGVKMIGKRAIIHHTGTQRPMNTQHLKGYETMRISGDKASGMVPIIGLAKLNVKPPQCVNAFEFFFFPDSAVFASSDMIDKL
jgi:hypothetical protein